MSRKKNNPEVTTTMEKVVDHVSTANTARAYRIKARVRQVELAKRLTSPTGRQMTGSSLNQYETNPRQYLWTVDFFNRYIKAVNLCVTKQSLAATADPSSRKIRAPEPTGQR